MLRFVVFSEIVGKALFIACDICYFASQEICEGEPMIQLGNNTALLGFEDILSIFPVTLNR